MQRRLPCVTVALPAPFAKEIAITQNGDDGFLTLFGKNRELHLAFLDVKSAFDGSPCEKITPFSLQSTFVLPPLALDRKPSHRKLVFAFFSAALYANLSGLESSPGLPIRVMTPEYPNRTFSVGFHDKRVRIDFDSVHWKPQPTSQKPSGGGANHSAVHKAPRVLMSLSVAP